MAKKPSAGRIDLKTGAVDWFTAGRPSARSVSDGRPASKAATPAFEAGQAPRLFSALKAGNIDGVRLTLSMGADPNSINEQGISAIHVAVGIRPVEAMLALLARGADPNTRDPTSNTPLFYASANGLEPHVRALLDAGADPNARSKLGWAPLHHAARSGDIVVADLLLEHGADPDPRNAEGSTPLHYAAGNSHFHLVEALLAAGADPHLANAKGRTPVQIATEPGISRLLISGPRRPESKERDDEGAETPEKGPDGADFSERECRSLRRELRSALGFVPSDSQIRSLAEAASSAGPEALSAEVEAALSSPPSLDERRAQRSAEPADASTLAKALDTVDDWLFLGGVPPSPPALSAAVRRASAALSRIMDEPEPTPTPSPAGPPSPA